MLGRRGLGGGDWLVGWLVGWVFLMGMEGMRGEESKLAKVVAIQFIE